MPPTPDDLRALEALDLRLRTLLPVEYQESYEQVQPVSMGSAGLKYGPDGKVAWNEIWGSFCDLAMAGGPPHRGTLLEPGAPEDIAAQPDAYAAVADEICRGLMLVTGLPARRSFAPGWVTFICLSETMADWLVRAITMENIAVRRTAVMVELPAGPRFRVEKEIKNVVTTVAKTCHYWTGHIPSGQRGEMANLFAAMSHESPLLEPALAGPHLSAEAHQRTEAGATDAILRSTGLHARHQATGWLGVECPSVRAAVWMMRALVAGNVLARREETVLCVPVNPARDLWGEVVAAAVTRVHRLAGARAA